MVRLTTSCGLTQFRHYCLETSTMISGRFYIDEATEFDHANARGLRRQCACASCLSKSQSCLTREKTTQTAMRRALASPVFFGFCFFVWYVVPPPLSLWLLVAGGFCRKWAASIFRVEHRLHGPAPGSVDTWTLNTGNCEAAFAGAGVEFIDEKRGGRVHLRTRLDPSRPSSCSARFPSIERHFNF